MKRWIEAYSEGLRVKEVQIQVQNYSSTWYTL